MKLMKINKITGEIFCLSNLHIGGSKDSIGIGFMDNPVIKHPITSEPYLPGSSIKGRMRCNMERRLGRYKTVVKKDEHGIETKEIRHEPCRCGSCLVCKTFGSMSKNADSPTRLIVRDAYLTEDSKAKNRDIMDEKGINIYGVKYETAIDRKTGAALGGSLRPIEYVPSETAFNLEMKLQIFDIDNEDEIISFVKRALKSLEETYIGGMGSRGYGQVKLRNLRLNGEPFDLESVNF